VERLGSRAPIPVETVPFAVDVVRARLSKIGGEAQVRLKEGRPFISDNGNLILDWAHGAFGHAVELEKEVKSIVGVVDCGIFAGMADRIVVAGKSGLMTMNRR
jgi:ribose 5-phosphate isomerase A